jgi:hypothetical protein
MNIGINLIRISMGFNIHKSIQLHDPEASHLQTYNSIIFALETDIRN